MGKNLKAAYATFDKMQPQAVAEGVKTLVINSKVKFDATAEVHFRLGIDPRHADQQIRSTITLPHGTGKTVRVIAICGDDKVKEATSAGAIQAGGEELVEKINKGWTDFDAVVATPDMMKVLAKAARVLGPKGLMPNPKTGTVTPDIAKIISEVAGGRLEFRNDKYGNVHTIFGKVSFGEKNLNENLEKMIDTINEIKPSGQKGVYIKSITINSTMGPGIKIVTGSELES